MSVEFKLSDFQEALKRLDGLFAEAFSMDDPAMKDWVTIRFEFTEMKRKISDAKAEGFKEGFCQGHENDGDHLGILLKAYREKVENEL